MNHDVLSMWDIKLEIFKLGPDLLCRLGGKQFHAFLYSESCYVVCSPFLLECMAEFAATYDDEILDFNGAELLTRVANAARVSNEESTRQTGEFYTKSPECFFPLSSENISRYG